MKELVVGTRGSLLATTQTGIVITALTGATPGLTATTKQIKTRGDKKQGTPAASTGDKKDWIFELEQEVLAETIDLAVHSGKDIPSDYERGTTLVSVLKREDPRDVFIGRPLADGSRLRWKDVPVGGSIGTASLRRQASLLRLRPDLKPVEHRGNVPTRLKKLEELPHLSGIVLAKAGIERLGIPGVQFEEFDPLDMMPAVNQGILCVQIKDGRSEVADLIARISDPATHACFVAERACVAILGADCKSSVSVFAEPSPRGVMLSARVLLTDGTEMVEIIRRDSPFDKVVSLGESVAHEILKAGGAELIRRCRTTALA